MTDVENVPVVLSSTSDAGPGKSDSVKKKNFRKQQKNPKVVIVSTECGDSAPVVVPVQESTSSSSISKSAKRRQRKSKKVAAQPLANNVSRSEMETSCTGDSSKPTSTQSGKKKERENVSTEARSKSRKNGKPDTIRDANHSSGSTTAVTSSSQRSFSPPTSTLSAEGIALLDKLRNNNKARVGKVSVAELMGSRTESTLGNEAGKRILIKLGETGLPLNRENLVNAAMRQMPHVPGFPNFANRPQFERNVAPIRPELFKTVIDAYTAAARQQSRRLTMQSNRFRDNGSNIPSTEQLLPWINFDPMYPVDSRDPRSIAGPYSTRSNLSSEMRQPNPSSGNNGYQNVGRSGPSATTNGSPFSTTVNFSGSSSAHRSFNNVPRQFGSPNAASQHNTSQKTRKPFFMPYLCLDAVSRGLANEDLTKGSLRVNQRNYEESYVDNPDGEEQLDLLILGVHDRNRALHGDVVVVRVKDRKQWVVRENLYQAWKDGHLNVSRDDNGKPLTVPPVPAADDDSEISVNIGGLSKLKVSLDDLNKSVPASPSNIYCKEDMVLIGAQIEYTRKQSRLVTSSTSGGMPVYEVQKMIADLSIAKVDEISEVVTDTVSVRKSQKPPGKKSCLRSLADMSEDDWGVPDICLQKTAEVVFISEPKNVRAAMGQLKVMGDGNRNWALFSPTDSRMPRMMIPADQVPKGFFDRPQDFAKFIFVARMGEWPATAQFARGKLERTLGVAGDIEAETEGLLFTNDVDTREFSAAALECIPIADEKEWRIEQEELEKRMDLREECIFTIDPASARDLDDALHIKRIDVTGGSGWEVGVHIADVSHFLSENTELDQWASSRATSVYLVHKVIPMLPPILCEKLCSLNPGVDRLTFSVIWNMDDEGRILSEKFGRSVIRSKVKLSYEHAQEFIERPDHEFTHTDVPELFDGFSTETIKQKVLQLDNIAQKLLERRSTGGALRLDQPKLKFAFDAESGLPNAVSICERKDANSLVEEFMLLANMAVARKIEQAYPLIAILRRHPPPKSKVMREVLETCEKIGFPIDGASSSMVSSSLHKFQGNTALMRSIHQVVSMLLMKPMQLAQYFCTGTMVSKSAYHHYALNTPFYTHFTSPIRRYPDVMVHRLLGAALKYHAAPSINIQECEKLAQHCNDKKIAAKAVSEASAETFFGLFVKQCGPIEDRGVVVNVMDAAFDVLVFKYGVIKRVYVNRLGLSRDPIFIEGVAPSLTLFWNHPTASGNAVVEQTVRMCSIVDVTLSALPEPTKYQAVIKMSTNKETKTLLEFLRTGADLE